MNWKEHINYLIKESEKSINVLKSFCIPEWGADPNISLIFNRFLVRSILDYGCMIQKM